MITFNNLAVKPYSQLVKLGIFSALLLISVTKNTFANQLSSPQIEQNICPQQNSTPRRSFETEKYHAYICLGDQKNPLGYFVRTVKNDNNKITVPLTGKRGETYTAASEEINYIINPYELLIYKQGRIVLRDRTINSRTADGQPLANACPSGEAPIVEALTRNFLAYVCQSSANSQQLNLHIIARKGSDRITAPLQKTSETDNLDTKSQKFIAVKGELRYILTPEMLKIWLDKKTTVKERVIQWN